ncbi:MAG: tyrosine-type recombinase/integrase [Bacteriovoracaceae bacterium]
MDIGVWEIPEIFFLNFTSHHTRSNYRRDITQFFIFLMKNYPKVQTFKEISIDHVLHYRNNLMEIGGPKGDKACNKTISRKLASLSSLFKFLISKSELEHNPVATLKRPKPTAKKPTQALQIEHVNSILRLAKANKTSGPLHYFLLVAFFSTGLRKSEILFRKVKDIQKHADFWVLEYEAKGGKRGIKRLTPLFMEAFENYKSWMNENEREFGLEDWLFQPSRNPSDPDYLNKPLNPKTINEIISSYAKKLSLGRVTPHSARATFITHLLEIGVDLFSVSHEVGHASVTTTQIYDKRRVELKNSPVDKLKISA